MDRSATVSFSNPDANPNSVFEKSKNEMFHNLTLTDLFLENSKNERINLPLQQGWSGNNREQELTVYMS